MVWFTSNVDTNTDGWRFDAVSLLAVIGESIIERQKHFITASPLSTIPRLLPAPQAVVTTNQLTKLPVFENVDVYGVYSGIHVTELNYFAGILHQVDRLQQYEVRVYNVRRTVSKKTDNLESFSSDTLRIRLKPFCAINIITICSAAVSIGLAIAAILLEDGIALVSILTMSFASSLACLSQRSYPELQARYAVREHQPPGDLVIRTSNSAFVVVHCTEEIARELYTGRESYGYVLGRHHALPKMLLGSSTVLLMASVLLFGNCGWIMQTAIAGTYIALNLMYWAISVLIDGRRFWDLGALYEVDREGLQHSYMAQLYTSAIWNVILASGQVRWVEAGGLIPKTPHWREWLREAEENITNKDWDPLAAKDRWMGAKFEADGTIKMR